MALIGLVMLFFFVTLAVAAPVLTPYSPGGGVESGRSDPPAWVPYLTGETDWSQNGQFKGMALAPSVRTTTLIQSEDSINFTVKAGQGAPQSVTVSRSLDYGYAGPPKSFFGNVRVVVEGLQSTKGANITVRIVDPRNTLSRPMWNLSFVNSNQEVAPPSSFSSDDLSLRARMGFSQATYSLAQLIFGDPAVKGIYNYVVRIDLPANSPQVTISVRDFHLIVYGSIWGILGTDSSGHDLFTDVAYGARVSLTVGILATFIGIGVGLVVGLLAGYLGGLFDEVLMRFTDMMLVLPGLPLLIVLVAVLGASTFNVILILGLLGWMGFARIIRSQVLSLRERPFIEAAKASGAGTGYITYRHIFPNIVSLTYVNLALSVPAAIVGEAALSFLGLGASGVTWGNMLESARRSVSGTNLLWWWIVPPGLGIALLSLSFILIGYSLDEIFNPRLRRRR